MDRLIYTAASGAKHILEQQATTAHNLANVTTTGFRAQIDAFRAVPVVSDGTLPTTRAFVVNSTSRHPDLTRRRPDADHRPRPGRRGARARAGSRCRWPTAAKPTPATARCR